MNNPGKAKVMFPLAGAPMIDYVIRQALSLNVRNIVVVVGYEKHSVMEHLSEVFAGQVQFAAQDTQLGTGHAVMQARSALEGFRGNVLILSGDVPLLRAETLHDFVYSHQQSGAVLSVLSVEAPDPTGYGRIIRNSTGEFERIVEHRDASEQERAVREINSGIYVVEAAALFEALDGISNNNAQGEYYLTDIVSVLRAQGHSVHACRSEAFAEVQGINTVEQLAAAEEYMQSAETEQG